MDPLEELVGWTPLHQAAAGGNRTILKGLLGQGWAVNARALDGSTALLVARKPSILEILLAAGADPLLTADDGWDAATGAAARADARSLSLLYDAGVAPRAEHAARFIYRRLKPRLLKPGDHDSRRAEWLGQEPSRPDIFACSVPPLIPPDTPLPLRRYLRFDQGILHLANLEFHPPAPGASVRSLPYHLPTSLPVLYAQRLVRHLQGKGPLGDLLELAAQRGHSRIVTALGAGAAALRPAVVAGHLDLVVQLLPGLSRERKSKALVWAAACGHLDMLKPLLAAGADPDRGALHAAVGHLTLGAKLAARLLKAGARPNKFDKQGRTALMLAADLYQANTLKVLLKHNALPNLLDSQGRNALHYALDFGRPACVKALLAAGADLHQADSSGWTPLHVAVASPTAGAGLINLLLQAGADADRPDLQGQSPRTLAKQKGRPLELLSP